MGALYFLEEKPIDNEEAEVKYFIKNGQWDRELLLKVVLPEMVYHIIEYVNPYLVNHTNDIPWWMGEASGVFTVKFAFNSLRRRRQKQPWTTQI